MSDTETQPLPEAYDALVERFRRIALVDEAAAMLSWDRAALMPAGASDARTEQIAMLETMAHEMLSADDIPDLLDEAETALPLAVNGADWHQANLREMRRRLVHGTAIDAKLLAARTRACAASEMAWREARPENDFNAVLPHLEEVLRLTKEVGAAKADKLGCDVYDALLDQYEPEGRADWIDALFAPLVSELPNLIEDALAAQAKRPEPLPIKGPFPIAAQEAVGRELMTALGFDFNRGRLDVSLHPFCGGVPADIRITTRFDEEDFASALMGVLHETGHALYEAGLPKDWRYQPVGTARGLGMHESQSLMIEMQVCRSLAFLRFAGPLIREAFDGSGPEWEAENLHRRALLVTRGFIRVDADEVTYPAHVILRYRLERAILAGDLALKELPGVWNEGMRELLGVIPPDDRLGCLQDIHWFDGVWGYFPTYTIGAVVAAQLAAALRTDLPDLDEALANGDFQPLLSWLREKVHSQASLLPTRDIVRRATGAPLDTDAYLDHLRARYVV